MKKQFSIILLLTAVIFMMGSTFQRTENIKELKETIEALNAKFCKALIENDMETYLSLYTDDAIVMLPFKPMIKGKQAIRAEWQNRNNKGAKVHSVSAITLEIWASEDMVYERGSFQYSFSRKDSNRPIAVYGSYFSVWQKQSDGSYQMKYDISNLDHGI